MDREAKFFIRRRIIIFKTCQCYTASLGLNSKLSINIIFAIFKNHISWEPKVLKFQKNVLSTICQNKNDSFYQKKKIINLYRIISIHVHFEEIDGNFSELNLRNYRSILI